MTVADKNSGRPTAETPSAALPKPARADPEPRTPRDLLAIEAATARAAMGATLTEMRLRITGAPAEFTRRRPFVAMALAAAAGCGLGLTVTRRAAAQPDSQSAPSASRQAPPRRRRMAGLFRLLVGPLFAPVIQAAKLALTQFLVGLVASPAEPDGKPAEEWNPGPSSPADVDSETASAG